MKQRQFKHRESVFRRRGWCNFAIDMAKQTGIIKLRGKVGDTSYYKLGKQYVARKSYGPERHHIFTEDAYAATRQHLREFGDCAGFGKMLREKVAERFIICDRMMYRRLVKVLWQVLLCDARPTGERTVAGGLHTEKGRMLLKGFSFGRVVLRPGSGDDPGYRSADPMTITMDEEQQFAFDFCKSALGDDLRADLSGLALRHVEVVERSPETGFAGIETICGFIF